MKNLTANLTSATTYNCVAGRKDITLYNAALFLGPWLSVWVCCAGAGVALSIRAAWRILPAVSKNQWVDHHSMAPCSEVIIWIAIIVATQSTHMTLKKKSPLLCDISCNIQLFIRTKLVFFINQLTVVTVKAKPSLTYFSLPYIFGWAWWTNWSSCPTWKWVHCWLQLPGRCP